MELAYCIGLCERNQLLFKALVLWLFGFSRPYVILHYFCVGGKQDFLLSVAVEGPIENPPVPVTVVNLSAAIPA